MEGIFYFAFLALKLYHWYMTKDQILEAVKNLPRLDRDEVLEAIVQCNSTDDLSITPEQESALNKRLAEIKNGEVVLLDGQEVMSELAHKYDL